MSIIEEMELKIATEILNKAKNKKPVPYTRTFEVINSREKFDLTIMVCPNCEGSKIYNRELKIGFNYCPDCGQKIDWSKK